MVDELEQRYGGFDGLNLCFETREGILKHCSIANARRLGDVGERFVLRRQPSLEAQVANLADEIAYNNHDVDDGLRSGLIGIDQLRGIELFACHADAASRQHPGIGGRRLVHETVRRMINDLVVDLLGQTRERIAATAPASIDDVRAGPPLVAFSEGMRSRSTELKRFLHARLYRHERVAAVMDEAKHVVRRLFEAFADDPSALPEEHRERVEKLGRRAIADYIAGMTDRYALEGAGEAGAGRQRGRRHPWGRPVAAGGLSEPRASAATAASAE